MDIEKETKIKKEKIVNEIYDSLKGLTISEAIDLLFEVRKKLRVNNIVA